MTKDLMKKYMVRVSETYYYEVKVEAVSKSHAKEIVHSVIDEEPLAVTDAVDSLYNVIEAQQCN
tara:strand:+ start:8137 stop:8328 length:192 start_codon:yes stop_codon:yes gene_type:complete